MPLFPRVEAGLGIIEPAAREDIGILVDLLVEDMYIGGRTVAGAGFALGGSIDDNVYDISTTHNRAKDSEYMNTQHL